MAEVLTDAQTFDVAVTVPGPTDNMSNAAEVLKAAVQKLVNRSGYLQKFKGALNATNTWTGTNIFQGAVTTKAALISDGTLLAKLASITQTLAVGGATSIGDALTVGDDVTATGALKARTLEATGPGTYGTVTASGRVTGNELRSLGNAFVGNDIRCQHDIVLESNDALLKYATPPTHWVAMGAAEAQAAGAVTSGHSWQSTAPLDSVWWPIKLPHGSILSIANVVTRGACTITLERMPIDWTTPDGSVWDPVSGVVILNSVSTDSASGHVSPPVSGGGIAIDNYANTYVLRCRFADNTGRCWAARLAYKPLTPSGDYGRAI